MKFLKYIFVLVLLVFFNGCSNKTPSVVNNIKVEADSGTIFLYRPKNEIWNHKRYNIYIDNSYEDMLMDGRYYVFNKSPGKHKIEIKEDVDINPDIYSLDVNFQKGRVKYIRFGTDSIDGHLNLKEVIKAKAIYEDDKFIRSY